ncbi:hypothetical protein [Burkholderia ambifaria]|jgi:hypothetical protein|uniref:hypothetical protein n=1 Tax=Burkholderia ambifaria TaxID=152480 RepID=UPI001588BC56|nr:hypothetical protein [Burkholderia ambifaria]
MNKTLTDQQVHDAIKRAEQEVSRMAPFSSMEERRLAFCRALLAAQQPVPRAELPAFPTMLRKMWNGGEVQRWIDEHIAPVLLLSQAELDVIAERRRQVTVERFTPEHDDGQNPAKLAVAAACYALDAAAVLAEPGSTYWSRRFAGAARELWQWDDEWWKPGTPRRDMEKAGALALATMERIARSGGSGHA